MTDDKVNRDWNYDIHQAVYPLFKIHGALAVPMREPYPGQHSPEECADIICDAIQDIVADIEFRLEWWRGNFGNGIIEPSKEFNDRVMDALDAIPSQTILLPDDGQPSEPQRDPDKYRTRTDPDAAFAAFMSMPEDEWLGLLLSLAGGGVLEPAEQQGLARALVERGER